MNDVLSILKQLFAAYPNTAVDEGGILIYLRMLKDIPVHELEMAVHYCICELTFLPGVSEILEAHRTLKGALIVQTPGEAWGTVEKALRGIGSWGTPKFKNSLTGCVIEIMGWRNLCMSDKPGVDRAQFMRMYEEIAQKSEAVERMIPEVRDYFENNVRLRLAKSEDGNDGIGGELRRLGLIE